jgi:hypothetical protein
VCQQRRAAHATLVVDVVEHALRDDAAACRDIPSGVEFEYAEFLRQELWRHPREIGSDQLHQLAGLQLGDDEMRKEIGQSPSSQPREVRW